MTTVEVVYRYAATPTEAVALALAATRNVYGIRRAQLDSAAQTLLVEYDATRLNTASVANIIAQTGLQVVENLPSVASPVAAEGTEKA